MEYRAVLFDLFETLITEWGHEKYTKNQMCADLGIERAQFSHFWDELEAGYRLAIVSNCSFEEVRDLRGSVLAPYFNEIVLSCEVYKKKPNGDIYRETAKRLGVAVSECLFVGDGGSSELEGALAVGMGAVQARWYTNQYPIKRGNIEGVMAAEAPLEVLGKLNQTAGNDKFRDSC